MVVFHSWLVLLSQFLLYHCQHRLLEQPFLMSSHPEYVLSIHCPEWIHLVYIPYENFSDKLLSVAFVGGACTHSRIPSASFDRWDRAFHGPGERCVGRLLWHVADFAFVCWPRIDIYHRLDHINQLKSVYHPQPQPHPSSTLTRTGENQIRWGRSSHSPLDRREIRWVLGLQTLIFKRFNILSPAIGFTGIDMVRVCLSVYF